MCMRTKLKALDPLTVSAITLAFSFIFGIITIKSGNKYFAIVTLLIVVLFVYLFYKSTKEPGLILENDFDGKVRYKPEEGCDPEGLEDKNLPIAVDGINTGIKPGKVFKVRSGTNVYIDKSGNVRNYSPISAWVNKWVSRSDFTTDELKCWEMLF